MNNAQLQWVTVAEKKEALKVTKKNSKILFTQSSSRASQNHGLSPRNLHCNIPKVILINTKLDFSGSPVVKTLCSQCRGCTFDPWSEAKIPHAQLAAKKERKKERKG